MRITLTTTTYQDGTQTYGPGQELTVPDEVGLDLIAKGSAIRLEDPSPMSRPRPSKKEEA